MCRMHEKAAIKYLKDGNPQLALFQLKSILKSDPQHADAFYMMGVALKRIGQIEKGRRFQKYADRLNHSQCTLYKMNYQDAEKEIKEDNKFLQQIDELSGKITGYE